MRTSGKAFLHAVITYYRHGLLYKSTSETFEAEDENLHQTALSEYPRYTKTIVFLAGHRWRMLLE